MYDVCPHCGMYTPEKTIDPAGPFLICPHCHFQQPFVQLPLFIVGGPSGAGKTTVGLHLIGKLPECVVMESDILWRKEFETPEDNYASYRSLWLNIACTIHQSGRPVVLVGTANPDQFETLPRRRYFSTIHYLALICRDDVLEQRLRDRPAWRNSNNAAFIANMLHYNQWLKEYAALTTPPIILLDTSDLSIEESTTLTMQWIYQHLI